MVFIDLNNEDNGVHVLMLGLKTRQGVRSIHRKKERKKEGTGLGRCSEAVYRRRAIVGEWHVILITRQLKKDFLRT